MKEIPDSLFEAIEHPERFSDAELEALLHQPEARELYDMLSRTADVTTPSPEVDVDSAWTRFVAENVHRRTSLWQKICSRPAAAIVLVALTCGVVVATSIGISHSLESRRHATEVPEVQEVTPAQEVAGVEEITGENAEKIILFKDETIVDVLKTVADHYGVKTSVGEGAPVDIRLFFQWDPSQSLVETVEQLNNFEKINISVSDNTLILH